jgi:hypothetical protein
MIDRDITLRLTDGTIVLYQNGIVDLSNPYDGKMDKLCPFCKNYIQHSETLHDALVGDNWIKISEEDYLKLYTADYKVIRVNTIKNGLEQKLEVIVGINNRPMLKHIVSANFDIECFQYK